MPFMPPMRLIATAVCPLSACAALAGASTAAPKPVNIYGVGNQNTIWEIDPLRSSSRRSTTPRSRR